MLGEKVKALREYRKMDLGELSELISRKVTSEKTARQIYLALFNCEKRNSGKSEYTHFIAEILGFDVEDLLNKSLSAKDIINNRKYETHYLVLEFSDEVWEPKALINEDAWFLKFRDKWEENKRKHPDIYEIKAIKLPKKEAK